MARLIALLVILCAGLIAPAHADFDPNNPPTFTTLPASCTPQVPSKCSIQFYGNDRPFVVAWGDSHLAQQIPAIEGHTANAQHNLVAYTMGLCPPYKPAASANDSCAQQARLALAYIHSKVDAGKRVTVILGGFWYYYWTTTTGTRAPRAEAFRAGELALFNELAAMDVRLVGIGQVPFIPENDQGCTLDSPSCLRTTMVPSEGVITDWLSARLALTRRHYLSGILQYLCDSSLCNINVGDVHLYSDQVHLNVAYTARHSPSFKWVVQ